MDKEVQRKKILMVEDELIINTYLSNFFRNAGYEVAVAGTGIEGLRMASEFCPDIVLLDLVLPDVDGVEVLSKLKKLNAKLPVIVVTGLGPDEEILAECGEYGVNGFVTKDSTVDQLLMHVKRFIG